jgi:hypothetical protein
MEVIRLSEKVTVRKDRVSVPLFIIFLLDVSGASAQAAIVKLEAVMSPRGHIQSDLADGTGTLS